MHNYSAAQSGKQNKSSSGEQNLVPVAVVGARGYSGLQLSRLLLKHPSAKLVATFVTESGFQLSSYLNEEAAETVPGYAVAELAKMAADFKVVFLATPAEVSAELAPKLIDQGIDVVDVSGAFRLKGMTRAQRDELYRQWYRMTHPALDLIAEADFGLLPWCGELPAAGPRGRLIANPGCYATSVLMALLPLLKKQVIRPETLVIDAKSGTSGAGRKAAENLMFTEVDGECLPYRVGRHQHTPEINEVVERLTGVQLDAHFTTHLLPVRRGIISGLYARLSPELAQQTDAEKVAAVDAAFSHFYAQYPLVRFQAIAEGKPGYKSSLMSLKSVVGTAKTAINYTVVGDKLYVFSLLDNLMKGAASQAVENFNRLLGLPVHTSLVDVEGVL